MTDVASDLAYLAAEAFEFSLEINPHAGGHEPIAEYLTFLEAQDDDWISPEQRDAALQSGKFVMGQVYPNGSVSFFWCLGTDVAAVVTRMAALCKEDRERFQRAR